jgi:plasmid stabilization system protein ParE
MAWRLIWAPSARLDLREISSYIAESRPEASIRFVKSILESVEHLAQFPESGRIVPEFEEPTIREIVRRPCRIVYRVKTHEHIVEIARVWHAARGTPEV